MRERLGWLPANIPSTKPGGIWLHAVSVGEVISIVPLLKTLRAALPDTPLFVSTSTLTGRALAVTRLAGLCDGVFFAPLDSPFAVRRVIRRLAPALIINLETEIWPNWIREAKRSGAMWAQVNARVSDKAWPKYERLAWLFQAVLPQIDFLAAQSETDASRFCALGFDKQITLAGNLKFDVEGNAKAAPEDVVAWIRRDPRPLWIAASTTALGDIDEDDGVLDTWLALRGQVRLLLAPRKPERFDVVAEKLSARGISFARRTALTDADVLLLDSIGELASLIAFAKVVFVGGTFNATEGHNILEPAGFGVPILIGPRMANFAAIRDRFAAADAVYTVKQIPDLPAALQWALTEGAAMGERGRAVAESMRGVAARLTPALVALLSQGVPRRQGALFALRRLFAGPWRRISQRTLLAQKLPVPVLSVGNLSMGGTGKTPVVLALAAHFHASGKRVGILTRGYGRASHADQILLPGEQIDQRASGDEAALFIEQGRYAVGIGADRYRVGLQLLARTPLDILLLDDGFQHRRLHRDFDLLVVDALNPVAGGEVPPAGWLREPLSGAQRADAIVLTRGRRGVTDTGLEQLFGQPLSRAEVVETLDELPATGRRIAFCGIGNPAGFRQSLDRAGMREVELIVFADHHRYSEADLAELQKKGEVWITTAKDAVKLPGRRGLFVLRQRLQLHDDLLHRLPVP
ncbi:tetraacyldisaccharide 4'-kinase [Bryobacter aggregatus]|uniref:tetraacyldisaccharide 4'-kinase n=1 Tax=Bryobacter aggregatus TaxID=360054 RepID=UPI00068CE6AE|nr:tetraacyldisaccharide 4'-kinase [Bryobacter aggregatus]